MSKEFLGEVTGVNFAKESDPLQAAYMLLGASTPLELSNLYSKHDQELMKSGQWDYENDQLITNQIKEILEGVEMESLTEEERDWRQEILWFWYHHAISCAIWRYNDREAAKRYADKALELQSTGHPNQITSLLFYLINDMLPEAEAHVSGLPDDHDEKDTAVSLLEDYKVNGFFK